MSPEPSKMLFYHLTMVLLDCLNNFTLFLLDEDDEDDEED